MLKILYLSLGQQAGMENAFRELGIDLLVYDFWSRWEHTKNHELINNEFLVKVKEFQPHLIHMQLQLTGILNRNVLEEAKKVCPNVKITNWTGDCRNTASGHFIEISQVIDYSLISSTGQLEMFKAAGGKDIKYWQIGYDPLVHRPLNFTNFKYDVVFAGNNYGGTFPDGNIRAEASRHIADKYGPRAGIFGSGHRPERPSISIGDINKVYNESICTLSISHYNDISHYFSDRLLHCLASGRPTISWHFPNYESYFVDGSEIFIVKTAQEIVDIVEFCKANPEKAKQVGINGHLRAMKEHTFTSRIIELLHLINLMHLV